MVTVGDEDLARREPLGDRRERRRVGEPPHAVARTVIAADVEVGRAIRNQRRDRPVHRRHQPEDRRQRRATRTHQRQAIVFGALERPLVRPHLARVEALDAERADDADALAQVARRRAEALRVEVQSG